MFERSFTFDCGGLAADNGLYPIRRGGDAPVLAAEIALKRMFRKIRSRFHVETDSEFAARIFGADTALKPNEGSGAAETISTAEGRSSNINPLSDVIVETFIAARRAFRETLGIDPSEAMILAARDMLAGGLVIVPNEADQHKVVALAACIAAALGVRSHVIVNGEAAASSFVHDYSAFFRRMGLSVSLRSKDRSTRAAAEAYDSSIAVVTFPQLAADHVMDGLAQRIQSTRLQDAIRILRSDRVRVPGRIVGGSRLCLVSDADAVFLDNTYRNFTVAPSIGDSGTLAPGSFAFAAEGMELSMSLAADRDFVILEGIPQLTPAGEDRLAHQCADRHGFWANAERRSRVIQAALLARLSLQENQDYKLSPPHIVPLTERCALLEGVKEYSMNPFDFLHAKHAQRPPRREGAETLTGREILLSYLRIGAVAPPSLIAPRMIDAVYGLPVSYRGPKMPFRSPIRSSYVPAEIPLRDVIAKSTDETAASRRVLLLRTSRHDRSPQAPVAPSAKGDVNRDPEIIEMDVFQGDAIPDHVVKNLVNGCFDEIVVDGLQHSPAVARLMMQAAQGAFSAASCRILLRAEDPALAAVVPDVVTNLIDRIVRTWPPAGALLGWVVIRFVRRHQRLAWRRYGRTSGEHKRLVRHRLAFMGR